MEKTKGSKLSGDALFNIIGVTILVLAMISSLYPLFWMFLDSFRTNDEMF